MFLLDSDLRGPLADYTFHYPFKLAGKNLPSLDNPGRAKQSDWGARALGAMVHRISGKTRMGGAAR